MNRDPTYPERFRRWWEREADSRRTWLVWQDGDPVGMVNVKVFDRAATTSGSAGRAGRAGQWVYVANLWVDPPHRGRGVGSKLAAARRRLGARRGHAAPRPQPEHRVATDVPGNGFRECGRPAAPGPGRRLLTEALSHSTAVHSGVASDAQRTHSGRWSGWKRTTAEGGARVNALTLYAADAVAIVVLVFGVYFPRHRRRDLVVAYLGVNVGVLAVSPRRSSPSRSASAWVSGCSACCRSSGCARPSSASPRSPTTSPRWRSACSAASSGDPIVVTVALMAADRGGRCSSATTRGCCPATAARSSCSTAPSPTRPRSSPTLERLLGARVHGVTCSASTSSTTRRRSRSATAVPPSGVFPSRARRRPALPRRRGLRRRCDEHDHARAPGLALCGPIGLDELNDLAALPTRVDRKYVLPVADAELAPACGPRRTRCSRSTGGAPSATRRRTSTRQAW